MKTLDDLVINRDGLWFTLEEASKAFRHSDFLFMYDSGGSTTEPVEVGVRLLDAVISKEQFRQRAKELGFVGRYRWGVEYPTDGKRPELADDVEVAAECGCYDTGWISPSKVNSWRWGLYGTFKITDQRYKPADTSYLDKPDSYLDNGADWWDYDSQEALRLPPAGQVVESYDCDGWQKCKILAFDSRGFLVVDMIKDAVVVSNQPDECFTFRPLDWNRKAKAERKRVVDAVMKEFPAANELILCDMYDKGFLRLPD